MKHVGSHTDTTSAMLNVPVSSVGTGTSISGELCTTWLSETFARCEYEVQPKDGGCALRVEPVSSGYLVRGTVWADVETPCHTCTREVSLQLKAEITTYFTTDAAHQTHDGEWDLESLDYEPLVGTAIDLNDLTRDSLLLELPMAPRCAQANCGVAISAACPPDTQPAVDSRLQALADVTLSKEK